MDGKNPRLGAANGASQQEIIQYLFDHDKAMDLAHSIASRGYFPTEPLLVIKERNKHVVVEGNRRCAALKVLNNPDILDQSGANRVRYLRGSRYRSISSVPAIIAPNRRATDHIVAGRHIRSPVLAWQPGNKARFIISKLGHGYDSDTLQSKLGFSQQEIQEAKKITVIDRMARAIDLSGKLKKKVESPRSNIVSTIDRVFESSAGQKFLKIKPSPNHGIIGSTTQEEFMRAFKLLVEDIASGKENSRTLNTHDDIEQYFKHRNPKAIAKGSGRFEPESIIQQEPAAASALSSKRRPKQKKIHATVIPSNLKIRCTDNRRIIDIRRELIKLKHEKFPNAGAALLRVFFELTVKDYLIRKGELQNMQAKQRRETGKLPLNWPSFRTLTSAVLSIAKQKLSRHNSEKLKKPLGMIDPLLSR